MTAIIIYIIIHLACGVLSAGIDFAYLQGKYPLVADGCYKMELKIAYLLGLICGPIALLFAVADSEGLKYGIKFW